MRKFSVDIRRFLDMLDAPVMLVDETGTVLGANYQACAITGKTVDQIEGRLCGRVLDCINAHLPEGCGKTVHCPDCTVRSSVTETWKTGDPVIDRPVTIVGRVDCREEPQIFLVSTKKAGNVVLLRLVPASPEPGSTS